MLEAPFSKEKVLNAPSALSGDIVPGLDGFSVAFWQVNWDFFKAYLFLSMVLFWAFFRALGY